MPPLPLCSVFCDSTVFGSECVSNDHLTEGHHANFQVTSVPFVLFDLVVNDVCIPP